eukprot:4296771-Pleurochrysis_carterae.AAC.1
MSEARQLGDEVQNKRALYAPEVSSFVRLELLFKASAIAVIPFGSSWFPAHARRSAKFTAHDGFIFVCHKGHNHGSSNATSFTNTQCERFKERSETLPPVVCYQGY